MDRLASHDPETLDEALALLARHGDAARQLADGTALLIALYRGKAIRRALFRSISDPKYRTVTILTTHAPNRGSRGVRSRADGL